MKHLLVRFWLALSVLVLVFSTYAPGVLALDEHERELLRVNAPWWLTPELADACNGKTAGTDELDGYRLPAKKGYTGNESAIDANGIAIELGTHVTFARHAKNNTFGDGGQVFRDYAINMRWEYAKWYWNGDADVVDRGQYKWMDNKPRLVKVSNPRTHKSVITAILEAGPAPWTGTGYDNSTPKFGWQQPQLGTPPESSGYKGRVAGLTPKAREAIGAKQGMDNGAVGDELVYEWALDQNTKPGTIGTATVLGGGSSADSEGQCFGQVNAEGYAWPIALGKKVADNGWHSKDLGWPCATVCHHGNSPAFDIAHTDTVKKGDDKATIGTAVFAIFNGTLQRVNDDYKDNKGCYAFQLVGDDGWHYWYGHQRKPTGTKLQSGQRVTAGQKISEVGERRCTGNGSYPHLHIDRGFPQGADGGTPGEVCSTCRDFKFVPLMNSLYAGLP
jgi:hypothetical protein